VTDIADPNSHPIPPLAAEPTPVDPAAGAAVTDVESPALIEARMQLAALRQEVGKVIRGQVDVLEQMTITLLCGGHALLEGVPGVAKTLMVRALALGLSCRAKRIQFTPDLMPSDVLGTNVFNTGTSEFAFHPGPIFTDLLLADEINRAPAKTQSALLEAMSERHATVDGVRRELSPVFTVFATQNPIEFEGTYPLPEAQQDRFLLKIKVDYPELAAERAVLDAVHRGDPPDRLSDGAITPVLTIDRLRTIQAVLPRVRAQQAVIDYVLKIVRATRETQTVLVGAGPRGGIYLLQAAKARALLKGRDYLTPDDVVAMVNPVLAHRMTLTAEAEIGGATREEVMQGILHKIEVPR
jgi:MoxR-like ATPase